MLEVIDPAPWPRLSNDLEVKQITSFDSDEPWGRYIRPA